MSTNESNEAAALNETELKHKPSAYMKALFTGKDQNAQTPDDLFAALNTEFGPFGPDVCPNNPTEDGLAPTKQWPDRTYINVRYVMLCFNFNCLRSVSASLL